VVAKDNTVAMGNRHWQIDKTRFRHTLAGCTVTVHEHLDATVSIRTDLTWWGTYDQQGERLTSAAGHERSDGADAACQHPDDDEVYGKAMTETKRQAHSKIVEMVLKRSTSETAAEGAHEPVLAFGS